MDDKNAEAMKIWETDGTEAAVHFMTYDKSKEPISYAKLRSMFG